MPTTDPKSGIIHSWAYEESGWNTGMDDNLKRVSRAGVHLAVLDKDLTAPPGGESDGDSYIVGGSATGDWAGQDNSIAYWDGSAWNFYAPSEGWYADVADEDKLYRYDGTAWAEYAAGGGGGGSSTFEGAQVYRDSNFAFTSAAGGDLIDFNQEDFDTNTIHDNATNNSRLTAQVGGYYRVYFQGRINQDAGGGWSEIMFRKNNIVFSVGMRVNTNAADEYQYHEAVIELNATDYVEARIRTTSGSGTLEYFSSYPPRFGMYKIGDAP